MMSRLSAVLLASLSVALSAATAYPQQNPTKENVNGGSLLAPGQFFDKSLDLHFNFPIEMTAGDLIAKMEQGHREIFGVSGDNDPEHNEAKKCVRPLLDAELPADKAPQRHPSLFPVLPDVTPGSATKESPIYAEIIFVEVQRECLPKKLRKKGDEVLFDLAATPVSGPGMAPITKPLWFEIGQQKVHMNAGAGRVSANGRPVTEPLLLMAMATQWRGHLLVWTFTSNDTETFNEITKSVVKFGDNAPAQMFPANIGPKGSGTPMTVLPK